MKTSTAYVSPATSSSASSGTAPSRLGSYDSTNGLANYPPSLTSSASSNPCLEAGLKTPVDSSPNLPLGEYQQSQKDNQYGGSFNDTSSAFHTSTSYGQGMHQQPHDWNSQTSQPYTSSSYPSNTTTSAMHSYSSYAQPAPGSSHGYSSNGYSSGYYQSLISSPPPAGHTSSLNTQLMPLTGLAAAPQSAYSSQPTPPYAQSHPQDSTGQVAPPNHKPKVTATLWEDEGTICFQVECDGLCVARRDDNSFINGTKLLNVAGMTRGRRDGILKSEKTRQVVKIGPMHLKGVWIPFDRALDFANRKRSRRNCTRSSYTTLTICFPKVSCIATLKLCRTAAKLAWEARQHPWSRLWPNTLLCNCLLRLPLVNGLASTGRIHFRHLRRRRARPVS